MLETKRDGPELTEEEAWDLLPWYVNGTLEDDEAREVERWLATSASLREALSEQRRLAVGLAELDPFDTEMEQGLENLRRRIASDDAPPPTLAGRLWTGLGAAARRLAKRPLTGILPLGAVAAALALVLLWQPATQTGSSYRTVTTASDSSDEAFLRVQPAPGVPEERFLASLEAAGLAVRGGPSEAGVYDVVSPSDIDLNAVAQRLKEEPTVGFVAVGGRQ